MQAWDSPHSHTRINCTAGLWQRHTHKYTFSNMIKVKLETTGLDALSHVAICWRLWDREHSCQSSCQSCFDLSWMIFHLQRCICSGVSLVKQTHNEKLSWSNICTDFSKCVMMTIFPLYFLVFQAGVFNLSDAHPPARNEKCSFY